ncbi:MAG: hypothetical protein KME48_16805 [Candidatus Thiodiazotropha sp. (ex Ctena orbiculata)]|nr:hypothetical protein [Candidatus Thiodiazotropha taylori]
MNRIQILVIAVTAMLLAACASNQPKTGQTNETAAAAVSHAYKIASAANFTEIKDLPREEVKDLAKTGRSATSRSLDLAMAAGTAKGIFTSGNLSSGTGASLWLMSAFLGEKRELGDFSRFFVWMPAELAESKKEAVTVLNSTYIKALKDSLPGYEVKQLPSTSKNGIRGIYVQITGPSCEKGCFYSHFYLDNPRQGKAPELLGGYDAYIWENTGSWSNNNFIVRTENGYAVGHKDVSRKETVEFFQRLSSSLPEWAYLYLAASKSGSGLPVILHAGNIYLFVEPEVEAGLTER